MVLLSLTQREKTDRHVMKVRNEKNSSFWARLDDR